MSVELVSLGVVKLLTASQVYALPARLCNYTVITSGGTIEISLDNSTWQAITLDSNKNFVSSAPLVRSTGANSLIVGKSY